MVSDIELHINTNGFKFTSIVYPAYRKDAIDILPDKPWEEYVDFINRNKITKAKVTMPALNGIQRCGFARAVGTNQGHDLTLIDLEGNVLDGVNGAIVYTQIIYLKEALILAHCSSSFQ